LKVDGPYTGNSYGGVASARTITNFNDGQSWVINFSHSVTVSDDHENGEYIQITNGYFPTFKEYNWHAQWLGVEPAGTTNLLYFSWPPYLRWNDLASSPAQDWSITLDPVTHTGRLFNGPDGTGSLIGQRSLDPSQSWYLRFMIEDGTSAGFGPSQMQLNIGNVSAVPEPGALALLLAGGGLGLLGFVWRRRKSMI
jgi:hypothetical protein